MVNIHMTGGKKWIIVVVVGKAHKPGVWCVCAGLFRLSRKTRGVGSGGRCSSQHGKGDQVEELFAAIGKFIAAPSRGEIWRAAYGKKKSVRTFTRWSLRWRLGWGYPVNGTWSVRKALVIECSELPKSHQVLSDQDNEERWL
jgi:hypothetical protein